MAGKAAFLDRDGTIIEDRGYLASPADVVLLPGAGAGLRTLRRLGYKLVLVSNQSGVARGLISTSAARAVHDRMTVLLNAEQVVLDGAYYCPHGPDDCCECRKPRPGLLLSAIRRHDLDPRQSVVIGDRRRDLAAGSAAGCPTLILLGPGGEDEAGAAPTLPFSTFSTWGELSAWLVETAP